MADDARVPALAAYPVRFMAFDKEAFTADIVNAVRSCSSRLGDSACAFLFFVWQTRIACLTFEGTRFSSCKVGNQAIIDSDGMW